MKIGFTGTRKGLTRRQWLELACLLAARTTEYVTFHHGDCVGADFQAHLIVQSLALVQSDVTQPTIDISIHPPEKTDLRAFCNGWKARWHPKPYMERNRDIVDCCELLIACPSGPEKQRSGTWSTVRYARKHAIPITIIWPDGRVEKEVV